MYNVAAVLNPSMKSRFISEFNKFSRIKNLATRKYDCPEKSIFFVKLPSKTEIEFFLTRIYEPQISNQIDAAAGFN